MATYVRHVGTNLQGTLYEKVEQNVYNSEIACVGKTVNLSPVA